MCGIAGIVGEDISKEWIKSMTDKLRHRGPDDEGYLLVNTEDRLFEERGGSDSQVNLKHIDEPISFKVNLAFGHRRLSIIDTSPAGHQPMKYEKDGKIVWIVYNGEIYNYLELKTELMERGYEFKTATDTEVILASYLEWGVNCVDKFNGMWAFVIYDPDKNILFGSRDRFGVKPLYYYQTNNTFVFASEIKAILQLPFISRTVNEEVLFNYLVFGITEYNDETFFEGIKKLLPSHNFIFNINSNKLKVYRYYKLRYNQKFYSFNKTEFERLRYNTKNLILKSVKRRLISDVPVGACLSGGIDSSSIVSIISFILKEMKIPQIGERLKVFTACYNNSKIDESYFASKVVEKTGAKWIKVYPNSRELIYDLHKLIYYQEEPFGSLSVYAQFKVMEAARKNGIKVMLDGQGGDELFGGYATFYSPFLFELFIKGKIKTLFSEILNLDKSPINSYKNLIKLMIKHIIAKIMPLNIKINIIKILEPSLTYINKEFLKKMKKKSKKDITRDLVSFSLNSYSYILFTGYLLQTLLKYEDRNSMAHSIEARTPFADDIELIEFIFSVPGIYKIHRGKNKYLLRESVKEFLPLEVLNRTDKLGFAVPEKEWLVEILDLLKKEINIKNPYIDTDRLVRDLDKLLVSGKGSPETVWRLINVILWMKIFDVKPPND